MKNNFIKYDILHFIFGLKVPNEKNRHHNLFSEEWILKWIITNGIIVWIMMILERDYQKFEDEKRNIILKFILKHIVDSIVTKKILNWNISFIHQIQTRKFKYKN